MQAVRCGSDVGSMAAWRALVGGLCRWQREPDVAAGGELSIGYEAAARWHLGCGGGVAEAG